MAKVHRIFGDTLLTPREKTVKLFNKDKFSKAYENKLINNINSFSRANKNQNATRDDVINNLQSRGFINNDIKNRPQFINLINSRVAQHRPNVTTVEQARKYVFDVIKKDLKYLNNKITIADVEHDLKPVT